MTFPITIGTLQDYIKNIFAESLENKLSLKPDIVNFTNTVRNILSPYKKQIEKSGANSIPMGMKGPAITFYLKIFWFMDEVTKKSQSRKTSPEEVKKLFEEAKNLADAGNCFHSWLLKLYKLPPVAPMKPFNKSPNHASSSNSFSQFSY